MTRIFKSTAVLSLALMLAACSRNETPAPAEPVDPAPTAAEPSSAPPPAASTPTEPKPRADNAVLAKWTGQWTGAEGTYLKIEPADSAYSIEIADLDGPKTYNGTGQGDHITFERNGKTESIRATDGDGTGMKWLAGKKDCLVVTKGSEGFCRD